MRADGVDGARARRKRVLVGVQLDDPFARPGLFARGITGHAFDDGAGAWQRHRSNDDNTDVADRLLAEWAH